MDQADKSARIQRLRDAMNFVTKNFAVISVVTAAVGATLAIIFIAAYLRVFDWRIIWIIEYTDVLKIGLIIVATLSSFSFYVYSSASDAINLVTERGKGRGLTWAIGLTIWCLSLGSFLWTDYYSADPHYALHLILHIAIFAMIGLWLVVINLVREFPDMNGRRIAWVIFLIVCNVSTLGTAFGYYTRDSEGFRHDVYLRTGEITTSVLCSSHRIMWCSTPLTKQS